MSLRKVKLGDILTESKIVSENPNPDRRIKVRLKVLGVEKRGLENEVEGATKQYIRKAGQFIYGKQNFHKGAFGIIPLELDGFESSSDLPAFDIDTSCLPEFIFYFFKQGNFYLELAKIASGVATQRINTNHLFDLEISLPDIKIQKQLISKLKSLEDVGDLISIELTHQLSLVKKLRQQLLQDAVQGKLVEQNKKDEPASELLKKIKAEKEQLISVGKLKKEKELPGIKGDEIPFTIPENWVWCRLGEVIELISGQHIDTADYNTEGVGYPYLTGPSDFGNKFPIASRWTDKPKVFANEDDILVTVKGAGVGKINICNLDKIVISRQLMAIRPVKILRDYVFLFMESTFDLLQSEMKGTGIPGIARENISEKCFPLPPKAEQQRIIQKLDELTQNCFHLEESIKQGASHNEKLLQQVLREALRKEKIT